MDQAIRAVIDGQNVSRDQITDWESRRLPQAARRISLAVSGRDLAAERNSFAEAKLALGHDAIRSRLHRQLRTSDLVTRSSAALARGRRATSICDLHARIGTAAAFVEWFTDTTRADYELSMLTGNPDHFLIATDPEGHQEVIETTGGSPLPSRFLIDYTDLSSLITPRDPVFPVEASGVARTERGTAIGGVRHQFRDTDEGFHARLVVEFPSTVLPAMLREHQWHLAAEFANWIELAFTPDE